MKSKFTEKSEVLIRESVKIAEYLGYRYVGSEHLLAAFLKDDSSGASMMLISYGINYERLIEEMSRKAGSADKRELDADDITPKLKRILDASQKTAQKYGCDLCAPEHIFIAFLSEGDSVGVKILEKLGADVNALCTEAKNVYELINKRKSTREPQKPKSALMQYAKDLTELARNGATELLIGRDREIEKLGRILSRKNKKTLPSHTLQ